MGDEAVLNLVTITNHQVTIDEARILLLEAGNDLSQAIQNFFETRNLTANEEPREIIPREFSQLVQDESSRNIHLNRVKRQFSATVRNLKLEMEIQEGIVDGNAGGVPKRKCLEDIYRNPIDLIFNMDLQSARAFATKAGKWIILLINDESFSSLTFNRDIFNSTERVKKIIKKNFILLRKNANSDESLTILTNYNLVDQPIPIFLVIDSLTGELKKNFGDTKQLSVNFVVKELRKYTVNEEKHLEYNSDISNDDLDDDDDGTPIFTASTSSKLSQIRQPSDHKSDDEESFASISSEEGVNSDNEAKVLDSDDNHENEPESCTKILLKMHDTNHTFKYPSKRSVASLINYIHRNYLVQTGEPRSRFSIISKVHNKCLTELEQTLTLEESKIHPSCALFSCSID